MIFNKQLKHAQVKSSHETFRESSFAGEKLAGSPRSGMTAHGNKKRSPSGTPLHANVLTSYFLSRLDLDNPNPNRNLDN